MIDPSENACDEHLSALVDGELDAEATMRSCASWRDTAAARTAWHAYHLIGDVLRSEELAHGGVRDAAFVRELRERMAREPVVLVPQEESLPNKVRWAWAAPTAVAAGFMALASALVLVGRTPIAPELNLAHGVVSLAASLPARSAVPKASFQTLVEPQALVAESNLIREFGLEFYLTAHQQFGGASAFDVPSGFLRSATTQAPGRWVVPGASP